MLKPAGNDCSLFPESTYINSCYHMLDLKTGISVHSCQQQHIFNQTRKHQQFNSKNYLEKTQTNQED